MPYRSRGSYGSAIPNYNNNVIYTIIIIPIICTCKHVPQNIATYWTYAIFTILIKNNGMISGHSLVSDLSQIDAHDQ